MRFFLTLLEMTLIVAIGVGLAFGANRLRGDKGAFDIHVAYFKPPSPATNSAPPAHPAGDASVKQPTESGDDDERDPAGHTDAADHAAAQAGSRPPKPGKHPEHEFNTISGNAIYDELGSPDMQTGLTVIIDARDDDHFSGADGGHIPGAMQCFPYEPARFLPEVTPYVVNALKVIVYCSGGSCEDSVMLCRTFRDELMVPQESLYLYEGGWEDWKARGFPVEKDE